MDQSVRIAVIGDIHGNLPGLEAAWRAIAAYSPDMTVCLGDLVQYGPSPSNVISFIVSHGLETIQGNCDRAIGKNRPDTGDEFENPHWRHLALEALQWTWDNLSSGARVYLRNLPDSRRFLLDRQSALFVHGLPGNISEGLPPRTAHEVYDMVLRRNNCRVFVSGHTHEPMVIRRPAGLLLNPGSVGGGTRPGGGTFAILDVAEGSEPEVEIIGFDFDVRALEALHTSAGLPDVFFHCLRLGRDPRGQWHTDDPGLKQAWAKLSVT